MKLSFTNLCGLAGMLAVTLMFFSGGLMAQSIVNAFPCDNNSPPGIPCYEEPDYSQNCDALEFCWRIPGKPGHADREIAEYYLRSIGGADQERQRGPDNCWSLTVPATAVRASFKVDGPNGLEDYFFPGNPDYQASQIQLPLPSEPKISLSTYLSVCTNRPVVVTASVEGCVIQGSNGWLLEQISGSGANVTVVNSYNGNLSRADLLVSPGSTANRTSRWRLTATIGITGQEASIEFTVRTRNCGWKSAPASPIKGFGVYPNPVRDQLAVKYDARPQQLRLIDINGRTVRTIAGAKLGDFLTRIDVIDLATGLYLLETITKEGERSVTKVQVNR